MRRPRPYLRRPGSRPPGQPRKTRAEKEAAGTVIQSREREYDARDSAARGAGPAALRVVTAGGPRRDRHGNVVDESLILTEAQEEALLEGLKPSAADIVWWFLQHYWNWSRADQIILRKFAEAAADVVRLEQLPRRQVRRALDEARALLSLFASELELSGADIVAALHRPPEWTTVDSQ